MITLKSTDIYNGNPSVEQHIAFNLSPDAVAWDCQVDNGPVTACNGWPTENITIGPIGSSGHTFTFRAWNAAGISSYTTTWVGGQPKPEFTLISTDIANGSTLSMFHLNYSISNGPQTTWSCTLDGAPYSCPNPASIAIGPVGLTADTSFRVTVQNYGGATTAGADWVGGAP